MAKGLLKSSVIYVVASLPFQILNFAGGIVLARILLPEHFGTLAIAIIARELLSILLGWSSVQYFVLGEGSQLEFEESFTGALAAAIAISVSGLILSFWLQIFDNSQVGFIIWILCIGEGFRFIAQILLAPLEKNLELFPLVLIRNSCAIFGTILAVLTALVSPSIWSLVLREVIIGLSMLIIGFHFCDYQLKVNLNKIKSQNLRLVRYGYSVALASASEIFFYKLPELIVAHLLGTFATGQLNQSKSFLMLTLKVPNTFLEQILFTSLVGLSKSKKSHEYFRFVEIVTSRLMMIAAWLVILVGPQIFIELFGSKWKLAASLLPYLAGFVFFAAIFNATQAYLYSLQRQIYVTFAYLIGIVSFIVVLTSANGPITLELTGFAITFSMASATFALYATGRLIGIPLSFSEVFIIPFLSVLAFWLLELPTTIGDYQTLIFTLSMICISAFEVALAIKRVKIILA